MARSHPLRGTMIEPLGLGPRRLLLRDARVLDLDTGERSAPLGVLVEGPRILDLDPGPPQAGWTELPCEGHTLMPGLIECHAHILSFFGTGKERFDLIASIRQTDATCAPRWPPGWSACATCSIRWGSCAWCARASPRVTSPDPGLSPRDPS